MTRFKLRSALIALLLFAGAAFCSAATVTVGPTGMYTDPCTAFANLVDGDSVTIDANGGTPYYETAAEGGNGTCIIKNNNLTISGINGRPIIDGSQANVSKGVWIINGHDIVINNIEFRNATDTADDTSANAIRIQASNGHAPTAPGGQTPNGGNITIENSYIVGNAQGLLSGNTGVSPVTGQDQGEWYSASSYITFQYDEFAYNGTDAAQAGINDAGHNFYIGRDFNETTTFTMQYSWSHDAQFGHVVKDRAPISNISYNMISDTWGQSSLILDFPQGGSTYVVGNVLYKAAIIPSATPYSDAAHMMEYREDSQNAAEAMYSTAHEDLHLVNNTVIDGSEAGPGGVKAFMMEECITQMDLTLCPAAKNGPNLTVYGLFQNNIFIGYPTAETNDTNYVHAGEIDYLSTQPTDANMAPLAFANPDALDFHITSGSSAINEGIYPPTDNTGATDPKAYAQYQYIPPMMNGTADPRPTPSGSKMDAGAFSYPPPSMPSLSLAISPTTVTVPGTGTITVSGLPTPPAGTFNYAVPISTNSQVLTAQSGVSSTGSVVMPYQTMVGTASTTVVPINVYADGGIVSGSVTVNPGPPVPYSITRDNPYQPFTSVNLEGPAGTGGQVVNLSSSNSSVIYVPSTVTVPQGQITAETGSLLGSAWGASPVSQSATITATVGSTSAQGTFSFHTAYLTAFSCGSCGSIQGGNSYPMTISIGDAAPLGGASITITSSNPAVVPNQTIPVAQGVITPAPDQFQIATNAVTSNQTVTVTASYNGSTKTTPSFTVTPGSPAASISIYSGNNQTSAVGTPFANQLIVSVKDSSGNPVAGVTVTFTPSAGVTILPGGAQYVTAGAGGANVSAEPTASGSLTVTASVPGVATPAVFTLTGTGGSTPASIAAYSGSGQSSNVGTAFSSPLVAIVKDSSGNPVNGATVTFSGTGLSFSPASAATNSSGLASTTATPTTTGSLTASASVTGVGTPATFAETGTSPVAISSITRDGTYWATTTVHLTAAAPTGGAVVSLSSSDLTVGYIPSSVTVPSGSTSAETGSLLGSLWGQSPAHKSVTFTGTYNGTANLTMNIGDPYITGFNCATSCTVVGGSNLSMFSAISQPGAPYGGTTMTVTSSNTAVIPNQSIPFNAGATRSPVGDNYPLTTNTVGTATNVTLTATFNGTTKTATITVNP